MKIALVVRSADGAIMYSVRAPRASPDAAPQVGARLEPIWPWDEACFDAGGGLLPGFETRVVDADAPPDLRGEYWNGTALAPSPQALRDAYDAAVSPPSPDDELEQALVAASSDAERWSAVASWLRARRRRRQLRGGS